MGLWDLVGVAQDVGVTGSPKDNGRQSKDNAKPWALHHAFPLLVIFFHTNPEPCIIKKIVNHGET